MRADWVPLLLVAMLAVWPAASTASGPVVEVREAWTRPAAAGANGAGYLIVSNRGAQPDELLSAASPDAAMVSIHISRMSNAMMTMRSMDRVSIPAHGAVVFAPGGLHLMLEGLRRPLRLGDRVAVTLTFAHAGLVRSRFLVTSVPPVGQAPTMAR